MAQGREPVALFAQTVGDLTEAKGRMKLGQVSKTSLLRVTAEDAGLEAAQAAEACGAETTRTSASAVSGLG